MISLKLRKKKREINNYLFDLRQIPVNYIIKSKLTQKPIKFTSRMDLPQLFKKCNKITDLEKQIVCNLGGLYVIGTERHDSLRIDNQLRGRSEDGAPGTSRFFLSLDDNLLRIFGDEKVTRRFKNGQNWIQMYHLNRHF